MENARYIIEIFRLEQTGWMRWDERRDVEYAKTKAELDILVECIMEDASINRCFYQDRTNGKYTHLKAHGKKSDLYSHVPKS